jgi:hypothetical protein
MDTLPATYYGVNGYKDTNELIFRNGYIYTVHQGIEDNDFIYICPNVKNLLNNQCYKISAKNIRGFTVTENYLFVCSFYDYKMVG